MHNVKGDGKEKRMCVREREEVSGKETNIKRKWKKRVEKREENRREK